MEEEAYQAPVEAEAEVEVEAEARGKERKKEIDKSETVWKGQSLAYGDSPPIFKKLAQGSGVGKRVAESRPRAESSKIE